MQNLITKVSAILIMSTMVFSVSHAACNTATSLTIMQKAVVIAHQMKAKYPELDENEILPTVIVNLQQNLQHVCGECHTDDGSPGTGMAVHGHAFCMKCGG
ncbi:MAG: hypothetical protein KIT27_03665 [Legionellales bacterium]|nr:hypothetical protein [Legionellales bacterium]